VTTFAGVLDGLLRGAPGRPLVTFYDHRSGERTELSVATYANWVAKTASLLVEECDLTRGDRLLVRLPVHWLGPVFLGAAWSVGLQVVWDGDAEGVVCGPEGLTALAGPADRVPVVATALLPLGGPFGEPLPPGVRDFGVEVWSQPDSFVPWDPPGADDPAVPGRSQDQLWRAARAGTSVAEGGRLLTSANPASAGGLVAFTEPFAGGGSVVLVAHPDAQRLEATYAAERATARLST
jgi:uncharacterized protein (TIGR03089 family)